MRQGSRRSVSVGQMDVTQAAVQPSLLKSERSPLDQMSLAGNVMPTPSPPAE